MRLEKTLSNLFIILIALSFNAYSSEVSKEIKACNEAVNQGDGAKGKQLADVLLKANGQNHEALICKARALGKQNQYAEAVKTFEQAVQATNDNFSKTIAYILLGTLHTQNSQTEDAIASYNKSLALCAQANNQTYSRINHNLIGDAYVRAKDFNAALDSYLQGVRLANNDNERAESFEKTAATYNALEQYDKAVEFQVKGALMQQKAGTLTAYADATLALGQYHYNAKDYASAERTYKKLARFAKTNGGAYYESKANYRLAEAMYANGDKAGAQPLINSALKQANAVGAKQLASDIEMTKKKLNIE